MGQGCDPRMCMAPTCTPASSLTSRLTCVNNTTNSHKPCGQYSRSTKLVSICRWCGPSMRTASSMDSPCSMKPDRQVSTGPLLVRDRGLPKSALCPSTDSTNMIACDACTRTFPHGAAGTRQLVERREHFTTDDCTRASHVRVQVRGRTTGSVLGYSL